VTYWVKGGRTYVFVLRNVPVNATTVGGGGAVGLAAETGIIDVELAAAARGVVDERTGRSLADGKTFSFNFNGIEPIFFSFAEPAGLSKSASERPGEALGVPRP
jgi:hypothetical protein